MKYIITLLTLIAGVIFVTQEKYIVIPEDSIRYRIIPNSNSVEDINAKNKIKTSLEETIEEITLSSNIEQTRENIINSIDIIEAEIETTKKELGYELPITINYGLNYFPEKIFNGVKYNEGYYESLVVEIGEAKGSNYWCVLYPPLCMVEETETNNVEYKFFVKEIIDKYFI